ncbi:GrpB family protein [Leifsonia shinshuensis]|uniref:GrpB family protein n=1 Tax=Leifsonia shinshuensis TaxID=150026 RepID=A0A7G6YDJ4_9MICO|nr:GrpB family protein [Leifsonia shinshuensis]QNE36559.1 GrpB family protein [Leifsonia shinshuensis]
MPTPEQITHHSDPNPDEDPWVDGPPPPEPVVIVEYDPGWPERAAALAADIRAALGDRVLGLEHVGSTSVPGLAAKDVIDLDLTLADSRDEAAYLPALESIGYRLTIREPSWHEHRCLTRMSGPRANLHVWSPDSPELVRHRIFRDWLRTHPDDRERYVDAKRAAIPGADAVQEYNLRKQAVIREIYDRAFREAGLL